jgi:hypothetical protein
MMLLTHACAARPRLNGLKIVCEVCGDFSIKAIDPLDDDATVHCRRCDAVRGTMADLRALARRATGEFEF